MSINEMDSKIKELRELRRIVCNKCLHYLWFGSEQPAPVWYFSMTCSEIRTVRGVMALVAKRYAVLKVC